MSVRLRQNSKCTLIVAFLALSNSPICAQTPLDTFNNLVSTERGNPAVLTYSQLSIYEKGEAVLFKGTIYLHIDSFVLQDCHLTATVTVQERYTGVKDVKKGFSGQIVHKETGEIIDTYHYKYTLNLKEISPTAITTVIGRPFQLADDTRLSCSETQACNLHWIKVGSESPLISETRAKNGFEDVNTKARQMLIPMSTPDTASRFQEALKTVTHSCNSTQP
jgi:hypothetical protein